MSFQRTSIRQYHALAQLFPMMDGPELDELVDSIATKGLLNPIILYEGKILDGRNRYYACQQADIDPTYQEWAGEGGTPAGFVMAANIARRHLTPTQRAAIGIKLRHMILASGSTPPSLADMANTIQVGRATMERTSAAASAGTEELVDAMAEGFVSAADAIIATDLTSDPAVLNKGIKDVKAGRSPTLAKAVAEKVDAPPAKSNGVMLDGRKRPVPDEFKDIFAEVAEYKAIYSGLRELKAKIASLAQSPSGFYLQREARSLAAALSAAQDTVWMSRPYTVIAKPSGSNPRWTSEQVFSHTPESDL